METNYYVKEGGTIETQKLIKSVGTHHGRFHADEVMATAILKQIYEVDIIRTRDESLLSTLDLVYDVGGGEFDHHDINKKYREDGIPYAACGLIWDKFGRDVLRINYESLDEEDIENIFYHVDRTLIKGIDAHDNGIKTGEESIPVMNISSIISGFNPPWYSDKSEDEAFNEAVNVAERVLVNTINGKYSSVKSKEKVLGAFEKRPIPQVMVLDTFCPWGEALRSIDENEEVLYVVYPSKENFAMQTVRGRDWEDRKKFPASWAGKRDKELADVTGVEDSVFCHTGRFIAVAKTYEGIMKLAKLAVSAPEENKEKGIIQLIKRLLFKS